MIHESSWANDQRTAAYMAFDGPWQSDEFADAERSLHEMLSEVGHPVAIVAHLVQPQPISMEMLPQIRSFLSLNHPNRADVVVVAPGRVLAAIQEMVRRTFGGQLPPHLHFVGNLDDVDRVLG